MENSPDGPLRRVREAAASMGAPNPLRFTRAQVRPDGALAVIDYRAEELAVRVRILPGHMVHLTNRASGTALGSASRLAVALGFGLAARPAFAGEMFCHIAQIADSRRQHRAPAHTGGMTSTPQPRDFPGQPTGGQFAETGREPSGLSLAPPPSTEPVLNDVIDDHQPEHTSGPGPRALTCSCGEWTATTYDTSLDAQADHARHVGIEVAMAVGSESAKDDARAIVDAGHVDHRIHSNDPREDVA